MSAFKESQVVYIFFKLLVLCSDIWNFFRGKAVWDKKQQQIKKTF